MAIYKVPPKPPKLVHTKLVCNDSTKEKWQKLAFRTFVSMLSVCLVSCQFISAHLSSLEVVLASPEASLFHSESLWDGMGWMVGLDRQSLYVNGLPRAPPVPAKLEFHYRNSGTNYIEIFITGNNYPFNGFLDGRKTQPR